MKMVSLSRGKAHLSLVRRRARHGESVRIQVRGVPVAELVPTRDDSSAEADDGDSSGLDGQDLIRRGPWPALPSISGPFRPARVRRGGNLRGQRAGAVAEMRFLGLLSDSSTD